jgi:bacteriorhodopsin
LFPPYFLRNNRGIRPQGKSNEQETKKSLWKWLVAAVVLIFFAFMALLPFCWEEGDDVPAPNPVIEGG